MEIRFIAADNREFERRNTKFETGGKLLPSIFENVGLSAKEGYTLSSRSYGKNLFIADGLLDDSDIFVVDIDPLRENGIAYDSALEKLLKHKDKVIVETYGERYSLRDKGISCVSKSYPIELADRVRYLSRRENSVGD